MSQEPQPFSEPVIGPANAGPDATAARSASRIVLIFTVVSQDGLDTPYEMRFWHIFSLANRRQRDWRRCRGDLMRNRFIPAFSFNHVGAVYRPTLHSAMHSIRRNIQIKKAPQPGVAAGTLWRLRRPNGPANLRLKRGYAASNSKTNIELSIFPKSLRSCILKNGLRASILRMRDRSPTWLSDGQHDFTRARTKGGFSS